ncbi:MAG: hypothetical protein HY048_07685 [Acidobacteria bacterium]|nr:hypothetical protein [Acidobacteriota bacterium]
MSRRFLPSAIALVSLLAPLAAQERINTDINAKIHQEENSHSQIMRTLHVLTDVYGPRVTGSPSLKAAGEWAINNAGLASIGFSQDPIEYNSHTHHTNLDHYERIIESDVKASAIAIAATLYQLAMRDQMVPRFGASEMPAPVK